MTKVAAVGHSRGGKTVSRLCTTDKRCRAAVIHDNLPPAADRKRGYDVPLLLVRAAGWEPEEVDPGRFETDLPPARGLELTVGLTRDFLDRHLRGVRREPRKDPEVVVRARP